MFRIVCLIFLFFAISSFTYAQTDASVDELVNRCKKSARYPDSLRYYGQKLLDYALENQSDYGMAEGNFAIGYSELMKGNFSEATHYFEEAVSFENIDFSTHARMQRNLAIALGNQSRYDESEAVCNAMVQKSLAKGDSITAFTFYNRLGLTKRDRGDFESALEYFLKSIKFYKKRENWFFVANGLINVGIVYSYMGLNEISLENFKKALVHAENLDDLVLQARVINNISLAYEKLGKRDSSLFFLKQAIAINEAQGYLQSLPENYENMAAIFIEIEEYDSAKRYIAKALGINKNEDPGLDVDLYLMLGKLYRKQNEHQVSLYYLDTAIQKAKVIDYDLPSASLYQEMAASYAALGNYESSYQLLSYAKQLGDSLYNQEKVLALSEISAKYELEERENQNRKLSSALSISNMTVSTQKKVITAITILLILVLGLAVFSGYQFSVSRSRAEQLQKKNTQIETLMRELHHRVKNNLQVISSLLGLQSMRLEDEKALKAVEEGKERIRAMSLIHQKLYQQEEVTALNIKEYIDNLISELTDSYGYSDKAQIHIEVPSVLMDVDTTLPVGLIINELVSNAFKYAYQGIEQPVLELSLLQDKPGSYSLTIRDNGKGLPEGFALDKAKSFGLKLVNLLTRQLKGAMTMTSSNGLEFNLRFTTSR